MPIFNKQALNPFKISFRGNLKEDTFEISPFQKDEIHPVFRKMISEDESKIELYNFLRKNIDSTKRTTAEERHLQPTELEKYDEEVMIRVVSLRAAGFDNIFDIAEDEELFNKAALLAMENEDGKTVLEDGTVLSRPLLPHEIDTVVSNKNGLDMLNNNTEKLQSYIDLIDSGLEPVQSIIISTNEEALNKYRTLTTPANKEGEAGFLMPDGKMTYLTGTLFPDEAAAVVLHKHFDIFTPEKMQAFIDLRDRTGFSTGEILVYIDKPFQLKRLLKLTTPDEENGSTIELTDSKGSKTVIKRCLSADEAPYALKMKNEKIKTYVDLLDGGLNPEDAARVASSIHRLNRYMELTTAKEDGRVVLAKDGVETVLPRPLTPDEALTVITYRSIFTNERIKSELENFDAIEVSK